MPVSDYSALKLKLFEENLCFVLLDGFLDQSDGRGSYHLLRGQIDFLEGVGGGIGIPSFPLSHHILM